MLGLVILAFVLAYLAISVLVVWLSASWAKKHNRRPWVWGGIAAIAMYNLVFWDWIPTVVMHKYYCATEAGFWVYKTHEQWAKENPGVLETLKPYLNPYGKDKVEFELNGGTVRQFNDRFGSWSKWTENLDGLLIDRIEEGIVDIRTKQVLVKRSTFAAGPKGAGVVWKSWLNQSTCNDDEAVKTAGLIRGMTKQLHMKEAGEW